MSGTAAAAAAANNNNNNNNNNTGILSNSPNIEAHGSAKPSASTASTNTSSLDTIAPVVGDVANNAATPKTTTIEAASTSNDDASSSPSTTNSLRDRVLDGRVAGQSSVPRSDSRTLNSRDPQPGQADGTATDADAAAPSSRTDAARSRRNASRGTVSFQEQFQAPNNSPNRVSHEDRWNNNVEALRKFIKDNGHCNVPQKYPSNPNLASFVHNVRTHSLSEERKKMLVDLGFVFNAHNTRWDEKFNEAKGILDEKRASGQTLAVTRKDNAVIYKWIEKQRGAYAKLWRGKKSSMTEDRISRLIEIGVDLDPSGKFAEGSEGGGGGRKRRKKRVCVHLSLSLLC